MNERRFQFRQMLRRAVHWIARRDRDGSKDLVAATHERASGVALNAAAAHGDVAAVAPRRFGTSIAALLAGHILQDGEAVILILKPSLWFILLSGLRFIAAVLICMIGCAIFDDRVPGQNIVYQELGVFILAGRMMFAVLQWMGRLYVLTDLRIIRLSGVFRVDLFDCPLRKIARTRIIRSTRERLTRLGTIEIIAMDDCCPDSSWGMVSRPVEVHEQIVAAIKKSRFGGGMSIGMAG